MYSFFVYEVFCEVKSTSRKRLCHEIDKAFVVKSFCKLFFTISVSLVELVNSSCRVNEICFPRIERMRG